MPVISDLKKHDFLVYILFIKMNTNIEAKWPIFLTSYFESAKNDIYYR